MLELGNLIFNEHNKSQKYICPEWVVEILRGIERKIELLHWNTFQNELDSPFQNTGARFNGSNFTVNAYSWDEENEQEWNFKYGDIEISWYKYLGRVTTINIDPDGKDFKERIVDMYDDIVRGLNG